MNEYPWYGIVEGDKLLQGDLFDNCPIILPPEDFNTSMIAEAGDIQVGIRTYDVVVMSQSCDLEQDKLDLVLVCPVWLLTEFEAANEFFRSRKGKEELRRGNVPGYHMLATCELDEFQHEIRIVDFRTVFSLPLNFIKDFASRQGKRIRLLPPYREHLAQAFARFFMRVGLPADIPPFK
jgi:hypothetical protein